MPVSTKTSRTPAAGQGRFTRTASPQRRTIPVRRRRQPEPTGFKKILGAVNPPAAAKTAVPGSKKGKGIAGGLALVAAAAGMAFKNRGKLSELRRKQQPETVTSGDGKTTPPATPVV